MWKSRKNENGGARYTRPDGEGGGGKRAGVRKRKRERVDDGKKTITSEDEGQQKRPAQEREGE